MVATYQQVWEEVPPAAEAITWGVGSTVVAVLSRLVPVASDAAVAEYSVKQPVFSRLLSLSLTLNLAYSPKGQSIVVDYSKYTRALNVENFCYKLRCIKT